jgi:hypothetical protein
MIDALSDAKARVHRYWNIDGLHEIAISVLFLLTAAWVWAGDLPSLGRVWKAALSVTFPLMLCGGILAEGKVVHAIRLRMTYRRTGFVEFRQPSRQLRAGSGVAGSVAAVLLVILITRNNAANIESWWVPGMGALVGFFSGWLGLTQGPRRFLLVAAVSVITGGAIGYAGYEMNTGMALYYLVMAVTLLLSGGVTLWHYLRVSPAPGEE